MYNPIDRHGNDHICFTYNPSAINEKLTKENEELKEKLKKYEKLLNDTDVNIIDGHRCYREVNEKRIENFEFNMIDTKTDGFFEVYIEFFYKDIDTDEVIAERRIRQKIEVN